MCEEYEKGLKDCTVTEKNTVILACTSLLFHLQAAQEKMGTAFPVLELDRDLHMEPEKMKAKIQEVLKSLPESVENVLTAMGFCGGSWKLEEVPCRIVIPRVDDCITLLLHRDHMQHDNLKQKGHMYFRDSDGDKYSVKAMKDKLCQEYGMEFGTSIFGSWFASYTNADIIDTGVYDCYSEEYAMWAQENADLIRCTLDYVPGSNLLLEKLVSGQWDSQFRIFTPGMKITEKNFYSGSFEEQRQLY